jgi:hypothetical protein
MRFVVSFCHNNCADIFIEIFLYEFEASIHSVQHDIECEIL